MFSVLPDLTPRDSHSLWYTSSRNPLAHPPGYGHNHNNTASVPGYGYQTDPSAPTDAVNSPPSNPRQRLGQHASVLVIERSALGRLREDERTNERRRANVGNLGSTWLKPPGVMKTLFQMREERREAEEHAEAMRREMLAQELAEAEAAAPGIGAEGEAGVVGMDVADEGMGMGMEGEEDVGRDLDDDIPDADEGGFGFDGASDEDDDEVDEDEDEDDGETGALGGDNEARQLRRVHQRELQSRMATMRATENRMREVIARGQGPAAAGDIYGPDEDIDEEDQAHVLEEEDFVVSMYPDELEPSMDMGMDANLDDDIPEAEDGYEHTDSEAELSSDGETGHNISYGGMRAPQLPPPRSRIGGPGPRSSIGGPGPRSSLVTSGGGGGGGPRSSLDISSILSRDGSSIMGSSPRLQRRG